MCGQVKATAARLLCLFSCFSCRIVAAKPRKLTLLCCCFLESSEFVLPRLVDEGSVVGAGVCGPVSLQQ